MRLMFTVNNQILKRVDDEIPIRNSIDYVDVAFLFNEIWDKVINKTVIFKSSDIKYQYVNLVDNKCEIPNEFLNLPQFVISVYGEVLDADVVTFRITTGSIIVKMFDTGFTPQPTLRLTNSPETGTVDTEFTFTATINNSEEAFSYDWKFDDVEDISKIGNVATKTFDTEGSHKVEVIATGSQGTLLSAIKNILVEPQP